jgi:hypothetical protein
MQMPDPNPRCGFTESSVCPRVVRRSARAVYLKNLRDGTASMLHTAYPGWTNGVVCASRGSWRRFKAEVTSCSKKPETEGVKFLFPLRLPQIPRARIFSPHVEKISRSDATDITEEGM